MQYTFSAVERVLDEDDLRCSRAYDSQNMFLAPHNGAGVRVGGRVSCREAIVLVKGLDERNVCMRIRF